MARTAAASSSKDDSDQQSGGQPEPKASKRRCVQSACVPCRRRKSKCDGGLPTCATCTAVYGTDCFYDAESENRRSRATASSSTSNSSSAPAAGSKRDASLVASSNTESASNAEFIVNSIRNLPEHEAYELIQHIRKDQKLDITSLAESWQKTVTLPPSNPLAPQSLETDLSVLLGKPALTQTGESRHFGHSSGLGLVPEDENYTQGRMRTNSVSVERQGSTWTNVTQDIAFVERLLDLYFRWSHPFYIIFSRECFYKDFRSGRDKYCSPLLVNAILAFACHFSDEPAARTDPTNFRTAGDHFFTEARRLLFEDETPSLTTTQALCVMAMREPSAGRDSSGFMYIGRCIRMCVELGLHLSHDNAPRGNLTPSEIEVRKVTFWGCYTVDTVWSICMGRISQLPRAAITLDKPILEEPQGLTGEAYPGASKVPPGTVTTRMFLQAFSILSELVNDSNYMFFAPKERLTSTRLLDCYRKYQDWYKRLPKSLMLEGIQPPQPHIIVLHMLYHTVIVHLFRPMLKVELIHSDVRPRDICLDSANKISDLCRLYRSHYSFRACHLALPHILLTICIVHLLYSKEDETSRRNLIDGLKGLEDISICHYFGARSFRIIHALAKTWNLPWPEELMNSPLLTKTTPAGGTGSFSPLVESLLGAGEHGMSMRPRTGSSRYDHLPPGGGLERRDSLSMFAKRGKLQVATHSRPNNMMSGQHLQSPIINQSPTHPQPTTNIPIHSYAHSQATNSPTNNAPTTNTSPSDIADTLFWTPVPGMGAPILARNFQPSPMDIEHMMVSGNNWERLGRDGFRVSDAWQGNSMNGYTSTTTDNFASNAQGNSTFEQASGDGGAYAQGDGVAGGFQQRDHTAQHGHGHGHGPGHVGAHQDNAGFENPWWGQGEGGDSQAPIG